MCIRDSYFTTIGYANSVDSAYDIKDTYQVRLTTVPQSSPNYIHHENTEEAAALYLSIIERIRQYPQVEEVCLTQNSSCLLYTSHPECIGRDNYPTLVILPTALAKVFIVAVEAGMKEIGRYAGLLKQGCYFFRPFPVAHIDNSLSLIHIYG